MLVTRPLKNFKKIYGKDGFYTKHLASTYHAQAVDLLRQVKAQETVGGIGDVSKQTRTKAAIDLENNRLDLFILYIRL